MQKTEDLKPVSLNIKRREFYLSEKLLITFFEAALIKGKTFRFQAKGWSMAPFIKDGDVVTILPISSKKTVTGSVVAFIRPFTGKLVVHRIVKKMENNAHIKGDNVSNFDENIPDSNILGCIARVERNGKSIHFGLGPERYCIALLSRKGLLRPIIASLRKVFHYFLRVFFLKYNNNVFL